MGRCFSIKSITSSCSTSLKVNLGPFRSFLFAFFVPGYFSVGLIELGAHCVWADYLMDKSADFPGANGLVETIIDFFIADYG